MHDGIASGNSNGKPSDERDGINNSLYAWLLLRMCICIDGMEVQLKRLSNHWAAIHGLGEPVSRSWLKV